MPQRSAALLRCNLGIVCTLACRQLRFCPCLSTIRPHLCCYVEYWARFWTWSPGFGIGMSQIAYNGAVCWLLVHLFLYVDGDTYFMVWGHIQHWHVDTCIMHMGTHFCSVGTHVSRILWTHAKLHEDTYLWSPVSRRTNTQELLEPWRGVCSSPPRNSSNTNSNTERWWSYCTLLSFRWLPFAPDTLPDYAVRLLRSCEIHPAKMPDMNVHSLFLVTSLWVYHSLYLRGKISSEVRRPTVGLVFPDIGTRTHFIMHEDTFSCAWGRMHCQMHVDTWR